MNTKNSKKILPATVFAAIIVLLAFAVMCTTASTQVEKTLDPDNGGLGDVVNVTIDVNVTTEDGAVTVKDTLPSELTYIGNFTVNTVPADPTVVKQEISYAIEDPGLYTIEFDVKVTEASWEVLEVYNEVVVTNVSGNTSSATATFNISAFDELWKEADGVTELTIYEKTETQWELVISVTNPFTYTMENTVITDRFGAEIEIDDADPSTPEIDEVSITNGTWLYTTKGNSEKVFLTWDIGDIDPGVTAQLTLLVSTDYNPGKNNKYPDGHQEYSSPSPPGEPYEMNSGATLKFIDPDQAMQLSAVTDSIYVTVLPEE